MFSGIVQGLCPVTSIRRDEDVVALTIELGTLAEALDAGASVAINGVCLTVVAVNHRDVVFEAIPQTLDHSNLEELGPGDRVNVERSFRVGDEIGGHTLSGHVSGVARIGSVRQRGGSKEMTLKMPAPLMKFLFDKGFVALDGASLTISAVERASDNIRVNLIPETLARTTFGFKGPGDQVNVEVDAATQAIVETVERLLGDSEWRKSLGLS